MEIQFQPGQHVKVSGLNRPCIVLSHRTHDRRFKDRKDTEGTKVQLDEVHYHVQLHGSSTTRFVPQSKLKLIPAGEVEIEIAAADPLPSGVAQSLNGAAQTEANARARRRAAAEEKQRLAEEIAALEEKAELDAMRAKRDLLLGGGTVQ